MGYTTEFEGSVKIDRPVDEETAKLLRGIASTRRMKRSGLPEEFGVDGEFYWEDDGDFGQSRNPKMGEIVDYNWPPRTQPGLWCQWELQDDNQTIMWDGGEKFYYYTEWMEYLISRILEPRGYVVNGEITWAGEESGDVGKIKVVNNNVKEIEGRIVYEED